VGRKTANVVLAVAFGRDAMPVDTHVFRVAARIGLTRGARTPLETERQLVRHIPAGELGRAHHWLLLHGRYVCLARRPKCKECGITEYCKYFTKSK
jgi:endonuclease-3